MTALIFLSFLAFFLYLQLGLYVLSVNVKSPVNRAFFYLCCCLIVWSFGAIFVNLSPSIANVSTILFWDKLSSFGWVFFPAFMVNFFMVLKREYELFYAKVLRLLVFAFSSLFFMQSLYGKLLVKSYDMSDGFLIAEANTDSIWYWLFFFYLVLTLGYSVLLLLTWGLKVQTNKEKKQSRIIFITLIVFFLGMLVSNYILPAVGGLSTPALIHLLAVIWVTGFGYTIVKYKFMVLTPALAANEIIAKMNELLFFVDNDGKILRINSFTEKVLGFNLEEIANQPFERLLVEDDFGKKHSRKLSAAERETQLKERSYIRQKSGEIIPFHLSRAVVKDGDGDSLGTIIVGYDVRYQQMLEEEIELRKKTEQALIDSEKRTQNLYKLVRMMCDNVPDMIWAKDLNGRYIFTNKATSEILLHAADTDEPIGKTDKHFYIREKAAKPNNKQWFTFGDVSIDSDEAILKNREPGRFVEVGTIRNRFVYLDVHKAPFFNNEGNLIGVVGCGRDVTSEKSNEEERLAAQRALETEKEYLSVTLKSIGEGVISTDTKGRIMLMNNAAEDLTGWTRDEAWSKNLNTVLNLIDQNSNRHITISAQEIIETEADKELSKESKPDKQSLLLSKNGQKYITKIDVSTIKNKKEEPVGLIVVFTDITDKLKIENELLKIQKMESISTLAGGIAHDFNNILTSLMNNLTLTRMGLNQDETADRRLNEAEIACRRGHELVKQLLYMSKETPPDIKPTALDKLVKEVALFSLRGSNCECFFDIQDNLAVIEADESQMHQLIGNLVINAMQAMPEGGAIDIVMENVLIRGNSKVPLPQGNYVKMLVKDSGCGMSDEQIERIYDPFYTTKKEGAGLGLTSCYSIVHKHNGFIKVDSIEGFGSTFAVYLPVSLDQTPEKEEVKKETEFHDSGRVLIMDDEPQIIEGLTKLLQKIGYSVTAAKNSKQAIDHYQESLENNDRFEFIILDLTIKGECGGKEVIRKIREIDSHVKAIVSSGYSSDTHGNHFSEYGFQQALNKPYTFEQLIAVIKKIRRIDDKD